MAAKILFREGRRHRVRRFTGAVMVLGFGAGNGQPQAGYNFSK
jgi:hypothetical protein